MQPAFLVLLLTALHMFVPVDCRLSPGFLKPEQNLRQRRRSIADVHKRGFYFKNSASTKQLDSELNGLVWQDGFLIILPLKTKMKNFMSIFDMKRKRFLCMDSKGELISSRNMNKDECVFQRIRSDTKNQHNTFYSTISSLLGSPNVRVVHLKEPPKSANLLLKRLLVPLGRRQRRSQEVNPSDPLRSESLPTNTAKDPPEEEQAEPDKVATVSKETITSCDDPLKVLHSNGPISPIKTNFANAEQPEQV